MNWKRVTVLLCNLIVCVSFGFGVFAFYKLGKPHIKGFYCNEDSLNKPFKPSTLPSDVVAGVTMFFCLICAVIVETLEIVKTNPGCCSFVLYVKKEGKRTLVDVLKLFCVYLFGAGITMFVTDVGKYSVGQLRPHFYAVCKPDWSTLNCTDSYGVNNIFVGDQFCRNSQEKIKAARLSFPSGQASFSAYSATYLVLYIQSQLNVTNKFGVIPKLFVQVLFVCWAFYCGCSRVADNKHHLTDVAAGFFIGVVTAYTISITVLTHFFRRRSEKAFVSTPMNTCDASEQLEDGPYAL